MPKLNAAFWKWFGKSKVVDSKGRPLVVYHGTYHRFKKFNIPLCGIGCHFGTKEQAMARKVGGGLSYFPYNQEFTLVPCYLSIQRPIRMRDFGSWDYPELYDNLGAHPSFPDKSPSEMSDEEIKSNNFGLNVVGVKKWLEELGYDGIVYKNMFEGSSDEYGNDLKPHDSYIAFYPSQIKSIDNDGTWDADDPRIRSNPPVQPNVDDPSVDDKKYLEAARVKDIKTCQQMVDEAAESWAPKSVVRTPDGRLAQVFRGIRLTKGSIDWSLMHTEDVSERFALIIGDPPEPKATPSFTPDREIAQAYSGFLSSDFFGEKVSHRIDPKRSKVLAVYLNITNPFDARKSQKDDHRLHLHYLYDFLVKSDDDASSFIEGIGEAAKWQSWDGQTTAQTGGSKQDVDLEDLYDGAGHELEKGGYKEVRYVWRAVLIDPHAIADSSEFVELLKSKGYDGMLFNGPFDIGPKIGIDKTEAEEWRPFYGWQIKSANPITWTDRTHKQVIPISQRFIRGPEKPTSDDYEWRSTDARYNPGGAIGDA